MPEPVSSVHSRNVGHELGEILGAVIGIILSDVFLVFFIKVTTFACRVRFDVVSSIGLDPARGDCDSFTNFFDPDGNSWMLQERGYRNL